MHWVQLIKDWLTIPALIAGTISAGIYICQILKPVKIVPISQTGFGVKPKVRLKCEDDMPLFYIRVINTGLKEIEINSVYMLDIKTKTLLEFDHILPAADCEGPQRKKIDFPLTLKPGASQDFSCSALLNTESGRLPKNPTVKVEISTGRTFPHKRQLKDMANKYNDAMDELCRKQIGNNP